MSYDWLYTKTPLPTEGLKELKALLEEHSITLEEAVKILRHTLEETKPL